LIRDPVAYALIAGVIVLWGLWGFLGKIGLARRMPPVSMFFVEVTVGFLIGAALLVLLVLRSQPLPWHQPWNILGLLSGVGLAVGLLLYYLLLERAWASVVVPVTATYPIVTVILSFILLGERLTLGQSFGLGLIVVGMILVLSGPIAP
jgi:transporter family protein